ncbi:NADH-quinone oxidoreductase subunit 15 [Deinococcus sp. KNUC1210]|uniref:NADH-quinone oxidoreductase subunit 15 n=1 Tax=Deinococcus sp. KNUC1210 TaxID=2917691 RepID=UPI001EEF98A8|nr:NADH-quinone oxidoreductase subunit 15 [Deinococcus sp. KNUC1210]ULH15941.1 NADH-quinone oxidoreductase subunit 15 [Deinococcus sp. KNUC1210]
MAHSSDAQLYGCWMELLGWMQDYSKASGLDYVKISDFPDYIYRMERPYELPTTTASASLNLQGQPFLVASVSPRHVDLKSVQLRLMGSSKHWHLHAGTEGLLEGKRPFTRLRLQALLDGAVGAAQL